jgi:NADPH:quinone reductase-like Zn-dependent oxidoreductase
MDVVFGVVVGDTFQRAIHTLGQGIVLVTAISFPTDEATRHGVRVERMQCNPNVGQLAAIQDLVDAGRLRAHVDSILPLVEIRPALERSEGGHTGGKIVLLIAV